MTASIPTDLRYQSGFGNEHATEAVPGALPRGRNSPQRAPLQLYPELVSGTAFTAPRHENRRSWLYRRQPSVVSGRYQPYAQAHWTTGGDRATALPPEPMRWGAIPFAPGVEADFVDGMHTLAANGDADAQTGVGSLMYLATKSMDKRAFVKLMEYLKKNDPQNTVIMVQPENEAGSYGSVRDFSPVAQKLFDGPVPAPLLKQMKKKPGTWRNVFGADADEFFHAWSIASYASEIAAAGKAVKALPMYMNAALAAASGRQPAMTYASGGPVHHVIDVYKAAAPAIDIVAPDIYARDHADYMAYLNFYDRPDNALFVPETGNDKDFARFFFPTVGKGAIGFAPFGMDYTGYQNFPLGAKKLDDETIEPFARNYRLFGPMQREWAAWAAQGKTWGVAEPTDPKAEHTQHIAMGKYNMTVTFGQWQFGTDKPTGNPQPSGGVAVAQLGENEFLVTGFHSRVYFGLAKPAPLESMMTLRVEEGYFDKGKWVFRRVWNGDSTDYGLNFTDREQVLRVTLATYKGTPPIPVGNPN